MTDRGTIQTVLLVEDNETIRGAFRILLEEEGYRVLEAGTGEEALETAMNHPPHLVLLDLGLPDINGLDVTRRLRASEPTRDTPILALTGRALETDEAACLAAGCTAYLSKPVDSGSLLRTIGELIET